MNHKNIQWLKNELPSLVAKELISLQQQNAITEYYEKEKRNTPNIALIVFSIFGAILLGSGIILILAHNWSELSRPIRTILSFLPLVVGQTIGFWTLFKRRHSIAWSEGIAIFIFLAIGSTLALISQTYHIKGDINSYLLTWMILALPLAYVFSSTTVSVFYLVGIYSWAISSLIMHTQAIFYWILLAAIFPMFILKKKDNENKNQATIIAWFISLSLIACVSIGYTSLTEGFRVILFISLFLILYIIGQLFDTEHSVWSNPFHRVGIVGLSATYLFLSYHGSWDMLSYNSTTHYWRNIQTSAGDWILSIGLPIIAVLLLALTLKRKNWIALGLALGLPLAFLGFALTESTTGQIVFTTLFNLYVFAGGITYMVSGIKSHEGKTVNFGFALVAAIIFLRFFDIDLSFVLKGIIFVILGVGFLSTNVFIAKRKAIK